MTAQATPGTGWPAASSAGESPDGRSVGVGQRGRRGRLDLGRGELAEVGLPADHGLVVALLLLAGRRDRAQRRELGGHRRTEVLDLRPHLGEDVLGQVGGGGDGGLRLRHTIGGHGQRGTGALGAHDDALEGAVGTLGEGLPVEDVRGRPGVMDAEAEHREAFGGAGPVQVGGGRADDVLLGVDQRTGGLLGVPGLLELGLTLGDLLLELPVATGLLQQRALRGQGQRGDVERTVAGAVVGAGQHQDGDRGEQQGAHRDDAEAGGPA